MSTLKLREHAPPCAGGTQRRIGVRKALSVLVANIGVRAKVGPQCVTEHSTYRARTCLAMRLSSPLQRCGACLHAIF